MYEPKEKIDLFGPLPTGAAFVIPVNGNVKNNGDSIMGAGVAKLAKKKYPGIERRWGNALIKQGRPIGTGGGCGYQAESAVGNHVDVLWYPPAIIAFPTKWNFWEKSDFQLIERSAAELVKIVDDLRIPRVYLPRVGCGNGGLSWHREVRPMLYRYFDARFWAVYWGEEDPP